MQCLFWFKAKWDSAQRDAGVPAQPVLRRVCAKPRRRHQAGTAARLAGQDIAVGPGIELAAYEPEELGPVPEGQQ